MILHTKNIYVYIRGDTATQKTQKGLNFCGNLGQNAGV